MSLSKWPSMVMAVAPCVLNTAKASTLMVREGKGREGAYPRVDPQW